MTKETVLVFDLGTSSLKAGLFDGEGNRAAFVRLPYGDEVRPDYFGRTAGTVLKTAAAAVGRLCGDGRFAVSAVVAGGNGPSWVALDAGGDVLGVPYSRMYESDAFPAIRSRYLRLLCAFRRSCPDVYDKASLFLPFSDYLPYFMTGEAVAALSCDGVRYLYWDGGQCREAGCPQAKLPGLVLTGERLGVVTKKAASFLGIPSGIPVYAGAPDYVMGLIGSGSMVPGAVFNRTGTSEALNAVTESGDAGAVPFWDGLSVDSVFLPETGARFSDWFFGHFPPETSVTATADALAGKNRGVFTGSAFSSGQSLLCEFEEAFRAAVARLRQRGRVVEEVFVGGSQAESPVWIRRKAAAAGVRLRVPRYVACELIGGAVLAAAAGKRSAVAGLSLRFSRPPSL